MKLWVSGHCLLTAAILFAAAGATAQVTVHEGVLGDAEFRIEVPEDWNGDLVLYNRSYSLASPPLTLGPLLILQLEQGYAVAGTGYSLTGWSLFRSNQDLQVLVDHFSTVVGVPDRILLNGQSMGALVSASAIETRALPAVVGSLSICGVVAGSRNWDQYLDVRLIYDVVCRDVPGAELPGGGGGLPPDSTLQILDVVLALDACTGSFGRPDQRTAEQQARLTRLAAVARIPDNFVFGSLLLGVFGITDLVSDPAKLNGQIGVGNANVVYEDAELDAEIERVEPTVFGDVLLSLNYTPTGLVRNVKIVSIHTSGDGSAVVENESAYAEVVPPRNLVTAIVAETIPTHCGFEQEELEAAWNELVAWVDGGEQPSVQNIQSACLELATPETCRFDPDFEIASLDSRIRPRSDFLSSIFGWLRGFANRNF